jgi:YggT family protein
MICATSPFLRLVCFALVAAWVLLFLRVIVSFMELAGVRQPQSGPLRSAYELLFDVTEPPLRLLRRIVPPAGALDLSVLVAFVIILVAQNVLC